MSTEEQQKHEPRPSSALLNAARAVMAYRWRIEEVFMDHDFRTVTNDLDQAIKAEEARRPSALLQAAKATLAEMRNCNLWFSSEDPLDEAIQAEEARGPSEIEQLRKQRDEALSLVRRFEDQCLKRGKLIVDIKKQRDKALAHAKKAEASADGKLRKLRAELQGDFDRHVKIDTADKTQQVRSAIDGRVGALRNAIDKIDTLLPQQMSEPVSDSCRLDEELRVPNRVGALMESARLLLCKERDEALALAKKAESRVADLESVLLVARDSADDKLREFADWIRSHGDVTEEEALTEIDRLLANPLSKGGE